MRAYDVLSNYDADEVYREGMIASAVGVFRNVLSRKEDADRLNDVISCLASEPDATQVLQTIQQYIETSGEFETPQFAY